MTKDSMILALYAGFRVRHRYFSPDEWMKLTPSGDYEFEDGVVCSPRMFWADRQQDFWQTDWEIIKE
jgi:hypothetical protein